jgi:hypothetical protein
VCLERSESDDKKKRYTISVGNLTSTLQPIATHLNDELSRTKREIVTFSVLHLTKLFCVQRPMAWRQKNDELQIVWK